MLSLADHVSQGDDARDRQGMLSSREIDALERQLKATIVALNKKRLAEITLIEAIDEAMLWPEPFDDMAPIAQSQTVDNLMARAPLLVCAIAAEIGFRFEGVGTVFWAKFSDALGLPVTPVHTQLSPGLEIVC